MVCKNYEGETEALIYKIAKDKLKLQAAKDIIAEKQPVQNSVRMQYIDIKLAIDSTEKEYTEQKTLFDETINKIANKDIAKEQGYFFIVKEAKIVKEGSMVLFGSHDATPIQYTEAGKATADKQEPAAATQTDVKKQFVNLNDY